MRVMFPMFFKFVIDLTMKRITHSSLASKYAVIYPSENRTERAQAMLRNFNVDVEHVGQKISK